MQCLNQKRDDPAGWSHLSGCNDRHAAALMKTLDIGVLPVCDEEGLVGILTDRDLVVRVLAATRDPKAMLVGEAMTPSVVYCFDDDDLEHAAAVMQASRSAGCRY